MNIGLVLSGGGMRGAAHIGAIKALEEFNIFATHISGSSAGAIVGALYAYGYSPEAILKFFKSIQLFNFKKYALGKPGFIDAEKFYPEFNSMVKTDDFNVLQKKLSVTATDILNGKLTIFNQGELIKPVLASAAFPGVFAPVNIKDSYYVDGGALNNFPVEALTSTCDVIIGVYANGYHDISIEDLKHSYQVVERAFKLKTVQEDYVKFNQCDLVICPTELDDYGTFERKNLNNIFTIGYKATKKVLEDNLELRQKIASQYAEN